MDNYVKYEINGLLNLKMNNSGEFKCTNHPLISIIRVDTELNYIQFEMQKDVNVGKHLEELEAIAKKIFVDLIINTEADISIPKICLTGYSEMSCCADKTIHEEEHISVQDVAFIKRHMDVNIECDKIIDSTVDEVIIDEILEILQIKNEVLQFIVFYELMRDIIHEKYGLRPTEYFEKYKEKHPNILFKNCLRTDTKKEVKEDEFSSKRNSIAHKRGTREEHQRAVENIGKPEIKKIIKTIICI